ncbi:MAG: PQQ-binding-like beta-propeller repeat protein [Planctomycetota bacterium]|nr:PQQ-binding-like beta-propeller repeat protein [Planctomycetota bacterium]
MMKPVISLLAVCLIQPFVCGDDWPHWMGPQRNNVWTEKGILKKFPTAGPKILWRSPLAGGYSGPSVANGKVFVTDYTTADNVKIANFERKEFSGVETVRCLSEKDGKEIWKYQYPVKYTISYPAGPRCTPVFENGKLYTLGAEGDLYRFDVASGKADWHKSLTREYATKAALWGYAAHPLIDGDKLITLAGGKGSHVVALDKNSGREIWKSQTAPEQGYSPPTIFTFGKTRILVLLKPNAVDGVNPETGESYWSVPYTASSNSIIMSPIRMDDFIYAAGYSGRSLLLKASADGRQVEEIWRNKKTAISPVNVQPFLQGNVLYGFTDNGPLCAFNLPDGERLWQTTDAIDGKRAQGSATAFIVKNDDRFILFNERGELIFANLGENGYEEIDRAQVIKPSNNAFGRKVVWSAPAFANRHAYIRNDEEIICVDLSE